MLCIFQESILYECFQVALALNRVGFAGLLMEQAIDVGAFLTKDMLEKLYNAQVCLMRYGLIVSLFYTPLLRNNKSISLLTDLCSQIVPNITCLD